MLTCQYAYAIFPSLNARWDSTLALVFSDVLMSGLFSNSWAFYLQSTACHLKEVDTWCISSFRIRHSSCHLWVQAQALHHSSSSAKIALVSSAIPDEINRLLWIFLSSLISIPCTFYIHVNFFLPLLWLVSSREVKPTISDFSRGRNTFSHEILWGSPAKVTNASQILLYFSAVAPIRLPTPSRRVWL